MSIHRAEPPEMQPYNAEAEIDDRAPDLIGEERARQANAQHDWPAGPLDSATGGPIKIAPTMSAREQAIALAAMLEGSGHWHPFAAPPGLQAIDGREAASIIRRAIGAIR